MEISKKHPPFLHYLKEMSAKMADMEDAFNLMNKYG